MNDVKTDAKAIFLEALDCNGTDGLVQFLEQTCGADAALRVGRDMVVAPDEAVVSRRAVEQADSARAASDAPQHEDVPPPAYAPGAPVTWTASAR